MELIDTHTHLNMSGLSENMEAVLARAKAAEVVKCLVPGVDLETSMSAIELSRIYKEVSAAVGLHPEAIDEPLGPFIELAKDALVMAVGEIGLDKLSKISLSEQGKRLRWFIELAIKNNKPVILHIREYWDEVFAILREYPELKNRAVIHCFTGGEKEARIAGDLGLLISVNAIIARPKLATTIDVIRTWPLEKLMLETDGPFLNWPGETGPNEPKTVAKVAQFIAEIKVVSVDEVASATTQTAKRFFGPCPSSWA